MGDFADFQDGVEAMNMEKRPRGISIRFIRFL